MTSEALAFWGECGGERPAHVAPESFSVGKRLRAGCRPWDQFRQSQAVVDRLYAFEHHYNEIAKPFEWTFTRRDLADLITRIAEHEPRLRLAA